ncbi:type II 3-dehydroquinate dehydratase [Buchnera aphidicola (Mollitrichosiphum nigrofasciatum)]|uniref:type II 3-dehydroquinate dehydratase n=1 Tax=Buchnera aphidicola TaxID=9 RepID=UPI0031B8574B
MKNKNILLLNGPNLNLLGTREVKLYGSMSLKKLIKILKCKCKILKCNLFHLQSNSESKLIDCLHQSKEKIDYIIFNPAAFTHTSIALRDAILAINIPFIEVHISNIHSREKFRSKSKFSDIANGTISGLGVEGYIIALKIALKRLQKNRKN